MGPWCDYVPAEWGPSSFERTLDKHSWYVPDEPIDLDVWNQCVEILWDILLQCGQTRVVSWDEVVKPDESNPGYPYLVTYQHAWQLYSDHDRLHELAWEDLGNQFSFCWYVFLKNEQVKKEKIARDDIRAIYVQPDPIARVQARFDQDLNERIKENAIVNGICVGFSPFAHADTVIRFLKDPTYYVEKDWKRYDGTIPAGVLFLIRMMRWDLMQHAYQTREYWKVYRALSRNMVFKELIHPTGKRYFVSKGNPSGQMSTSIDNCLANIFILNYIHLVVYGEPVYSCQVYGDDVIQGYRCTPDVGAESEVAKHVFGMWLPEDRAVVKGTPEGLSFCGFEFAKVRGRWVPKYKPHKIIANLYRPVNRPDSNWIEIRWAQLISAGLLLFFTDYFYIPYNLLVKHYTGTEFFVPSKKWFAQVINAVLEEEDGWTKMLVLGHGDQWTRAHQRLV